MDPQQQGDVVVDGRSVGFRWRDVVADAPRAVLALTLLHVGLLLVWSLLIPPFDGPDEPQHLDLVVGAFDLGWEWPAPDDRTFFPELPDALEAVRFTTPDTAFFDRALDPVSAGMAAPRDERPRWDELEASPGRAFNAIAQHPPLMHRLYRIALALVPGWGQLAVDELIGVMRLMTIVVAAPLPLLIHRIVRVAGGTDPTALTAAAAVVVVPQLSHMGSVISNDPLLVLLCAAALLVATHVAAGDLRRRTALWLGGLTAAALLTKAFAVALLPVVGIAYLAGGLRRRALEGGATRASGRAPGRAWRSAAVALLVAVPGTAFYVENMVRYGEPFPSIYSMADPGAGRGGTAPALRWGQAGIDLVRDLVRTGWGAFGWMEAIMPERAQWTAAAIATALVLVGVAAVLWRPRGSRLVGSAPLWPAMTHAAAVIGVLAAGGAVAFYRYGIVPGVQGRYALAALPALAVLGAHGATRLLRAAPPPAAPTLLLAGAAVMQVLAALTALERYWGPPGGTLVQQLHAVGAWSPWPAPVTAAFAGVLVLGVVAVAAHLGTGWRAALSAPAGPPDGPATPPGRTPRRSPAATAR